MKSTPVAFWIWNKRKSPMTLAPSRPSSGKASLKFRVLNSLCGVNLYRKAEKLIAKSRREKREAAKWEAKGLQ